MKNKTSKSSKAIKFIVSDDQAPRIAVKPGMKFKAEAIELIDPNLKKTKIGAARLCGGTSTCVALIDIED